LYRMDNENLTDVELGKLQKEVFDAIHDKGENPLWQQTYQEVTNEASTRSWFSFFTGVYVKPFTMQEAELNRLRDQNTLLRSSMNNWQQRQVFEVPEDPEGAWAYYQAYQDTPEGWVTHMRADLGWVTDDNNELVTDPKERARYLATKMEQRQITEAYYDALDELNKQFNERLMNEAPIGSPYETREPLYDWYYKQREIIDTMYPSTYERKYGTYKPKELIQRELANKWFKLLYSTRPTWNYEDGEKYPDYQARIDEWVKDLEQKAPRLPRLWSGSKEGQTFKTCLLPCTKTRRA
jgi:hypothetical protein